MEPVPAAISEWFVWPSCHEAVDRHGVVWYHEQLSLPLARHGSRSLRGPESRGIASGNGLPRPGTPGLISTRKESSADSAVKPESCRNEQAWAREGRSCRC